MQLFTITAGLFTLSAVAAVAATSIAAAPPSRRPVAMDYVTLVYDSYTLPNLHFSLAGKQRRSSGTQNAGDKQMGQLTFSLSDTCTSLGPGTTCPSHGQSTTCTMDGIDPNPDSKEFADAKCGMYVFLLWSPANRPPPTVLIPAGTWPLITSITSRMVPK